MLQDPTWWCRLFSRGSSRFAMHRGVLSLQFYRCKGRAAGGRPGSNLQGNGSVLRVMTNDIAGNSILNGKTVTDMADSHSQSTSSITAIQQDDPSRGPFQLLADYEAGPEWLRASVAAMTSEHLRLRPVPGKWSAL